VEFLSLTRDTSEADMKQRREIKGKTSLFIDQHAVRAAIEGRVLVIEGLEKAERNILPILVRRKFRSFFLFISVLFRIICWKIER